MGLGVLLFTWNMMMLLTAFPLRLSIVQDEKKKRVQCGEKKLFF